MTPALKPPDPTTPSWIDRARTVGRATWKGTKTVGRWIVWPFSRVGDWAGKLRLPAAAALTILFLLTVAAVVLWATGRPQGGDWWDIHYDVLPWKERLTIAGAVAAGAGAAVALVVGYRKQRDAEDGKFAAAFADAAAQLGDDTPAVRMAGAYALAALADRYSQHRQQCIDTLCAYLRLPYDPDAAKRNVATITRTEGERVETTVHRANDREVRLTVIRIIRDHLRNPRARTTWCRYDLDFTGATFDGGDFSGAKFSGGRVSFDRATFSGGDVSFYDAKFSDGRVSFGRAKFSDGRVSFSAATFSGGEVSFDWATFSGGQVSFSGATFSGGEVSFDWATFSGRQVLFLEAVFSGGAVSFSGATFSDDGRVSFDRATFSDGAVSFPYATFSGGRVSFDRATFSGGDVSFYDATLSSGQVSFDRAKFSDGRVSFDRATFSGGGVTKEGKAFRGWSAEHGFASR